MADREPTADDIRGFMEEDERRDWDSGKGTPEEREKQWQTLVELWKATPDPTDEQLQPPYMRPDEWQVCQTDYRARENILNFYRRQWKRQRKAEARAEVERQKQASKEPPEQPSDKPSPPKPETKGPIDLYELLTKAEANPPTAEEEAKNKEALEKLARSFMAYDEEMRKRGEKLLEGFRRAADGVQLSSDLLSDSGLHEYFAKRKKASDDLPAEMESDPGWLQFHRNPDGAVELRRHYSEAEEEARRKAEIEEQSRAMEKAFDRALKKAEDRARTQRELEELTRRAGFTPIDAAQPRTVQEQKPGNAIAWLAVGFALLERGLDVIGFHSLSIGALLFAAAFISFCVWFVRTEIAQRWKFRTRTVVICIAALIYFPVFGKQLYTQYRAERAASSPATSPAPSQRQSGTIQSPKSEAEPLTDVDPAYLVGLYQKYNSALADQVVKTYIGRPLKASGVVGDVSRNGDDVSVLLMVKRIDGWTLYAISARFDEQMWKDRAVVFSKGEKVTVSGKIRGASETSVFLEHCQIIE